MPPTRAQLLAEAQSLCSDFANKADTNTILSHFSSTHSISAYECGEEFFVPFVGREFSGRTGPTSVFTYFSLLQKYLTYDKMTFGEWVVDAETLKVCVKGRAKFTWIEGKGEGQSWDEDFIYMLNFDHEGKVTDYQVWADSVAAYLASRGELADKRKEFEAAK